MNTGDAVYMVTSLFFHSCFVCHLPALLEIEYAWVPWRVPETINDEPVQIGVTMFSCQSSGKGIDQSDVPVAALMPTTEPLVMVMIWRTPSIVATTGDA